PHTAPILVAPVVHPLPPTKKRAAAPSTSRQTKPAFRRPAALPETAFRTTCFRPARANCATGCRCRNSATTHFHTALSPRSDRRAGTVRESPSPGPSTKESEKKCRTQSVRTPAGPPSSLLAPHSPLPPARDAAGASWRAFPVEMRARIQTTAHGTPPLPAGSNRENVRTKARSLADVSAAGPRGPCPDLAPSRTGAVQSQPPR